MSPINVAPSVGRRHDELDGSASAPDRAGVWNIRRGAGSTIVYVVGVVLLLSTLPAAVDAKPVCGADEYHVRGQCFPCSTCPVYLIVRRPCTPDSDTLCGPLYDFEFLNVNDGASQADGRHAKGSHRRHPKPAVDASSLTSSNAVFDIHSENSGSASDQCSGATWRVFCYGIITAMIFFTLVAVVTVIALRPTCWGTCFRRKSHVENHLHTSVSEGDSPELVAVWSNGSERGDGLRTALVVDRRVRHLETQLYVNRRRRAFLARIFGLDDDDDDDESRTHGRRARSSLLHPGNEYFDERCRLRMLHAGIDLSLPPPSSPLASSVTPSSSVDPHLDVSESASSQHPQPATSQPAST